MFSLETVLKYPVVFGVGLMVALLVTPLWMKLAARLGFVDEPGGRKIHKRAVPVGGGVAIFLAFHAACAALFLLPWAPFAGQLDPEWWFRLIPLTGCVLVLGLVDDWRGLRPLVKLLGQLLIAWGAYASGISIQHALGQAVPGWVDFAATLLWFVVFMNAFNLIDGVDGLATGIGAIAAMGVALSLVFRRSPGDVLLLLGFVGACLGFLRYNFHPARVFLGDTGSLLIGFCLAALSVSTSSKGTALAVVGMPLLAAGVPLFDAVLAVWRRSVRYVLGVKRGERGVAGVADGDAEHLHHRLLHGGRATHQVAWLLYAATGVLVLIGVLTTVFKDRTIGILSVALVLGAYTVFRHLVWIELRDTGELVLHGLSKPVRRNLSLISYIVVDLFVFNVSWFVAYWLVSAGHGDGNVFLGAKEAWFHAFPTAVVIPFLAFLGVQAYSRAWAFACLVEFFTLGAAGVAAGVLACAFSLLSPSLPGSAHQVVLMCVVQFGLVIPCCVGARILFHVAQAVLHRSDMRAARMGVGGRRCIVAGSGPELLLFFRSRRVKGQADDDLCFVGVVSDDEALRGHSVCGMRVLGTTHDLEWLIGRFKVCHLILLGDEPQLPEGVRLGAGRGALDAVRWRYVSEPVGSVPEQGA